MFVCICHAVTERQIIAAAQRGASRLADLRKELGVPGNCGRCGVCAKELLRQVADGRHFSETPQVACS